MTKPSHYPINLIWFSLSIFTWRIYIFYVHGNQSPTIVKEKQVLETESNRQSGSKSRYHNGKTKPTIRLIEQQVALGAINEQATRKHMNYGH